MSACYLASTCLRYRHLFFITRPLLRTLPLSTLAMSYRPNYQGGRRGGGGGRGGGGRGGGGRGRGGRGGAGEQRWWDPVWRAERLRQQAAELEVLDENEWWGTMEQMKRGAEQEMVIKRSFGRRDQQTLSDMAAQLGLHFHAYNKGKTLVLSKVPFPDYRADLDEHHGSTQKEIQMSSEIEKRVGTLLDTSTSLATTKKSVDGCSQNDKQSALIPSVVRTLPISAKEKNTADKEKINVELKQREQRIKACYVF